MAGVYAFFESITTVIFLSIGVIVSGRERKAFRNEIRSESLLTGVLMGVAIHVTYTIVLASMAFVKDVSYVVAFRQLWLSRNLFAWRHHSTYSGALLMFTGVVIVAIG